MQYDAWFRYLINYKKELPFTPCCMSRIYSSLSKYPRKNVRIIYVYLSLIRGSSHTPTPSPIAVKKALVNKNFSLKAGTFDIEFLFWKDVPLQTTFFSQNEPHFPLNYYTQMSFLLNTQWRQLKHMKQQD